MRAIVKGIEPASLTTHRLGAHCDYGNYADKDGLREALVRDQRGLCCYCMGRIEATRASMKIEHWQRQNATQRDLEYWNLLGSCLGGEGQPEVRQHCDTRKGEQHLKFNPANPDHLVEGRVHFELNGTIRSSDDDFDTQLNDVLNLNMQLLKNRRKGVVDGFVDWLNEYRRVHHRRPDNATLRRERSKWDAAGGLLKPYAGVALWWLDRRLAVGAT